MSDLPRLSARSKARKRALDILFEAELRERDALVTLEERAAEADPPVTGFSRDLVQGVVAHRADIDHRIATYLSTEWTIERMPRVDRNLARIAVYELDYTGLADGVVISEALELAAALSTDESPTFMNGLLAKAAQHRLHAAR